MIDLGFGSNEHYNMSKALRGTPVSQRKPYFNKLRNLGLIEMDGLPSDEVKDALLL